LLNLRIFAATGLTGWVLPTGNANETAGALNQFKSIWTNAGGTEADLLAQFDGVQSYLNLYWSATERPTQLHRVWNFHPYDGTLEGSFNQGYDGKSNSLYALATRAGDVATTVPEPQTLALALLAFCAIVLRRRP
jgi:hypothetical protein